MSLHDASGMQDSMLMIARDGKYRGVKGVTTRLHGKGATVRKAT